MHMIVIWQSIRSSVAWCFRAVTKQVSSLRQRFAGPKFADNRVSSWVVLLHYESACRGSDAFVCLPSHLRGILLRCNSTQLGKSPAGPSLQGRSQSGTRHGRVGRTPSWMV